MSHVLIITIKLFDVSVIEGTQAIPVLFNGPLPLQVNPRI